MSTLPLVRIVAGTLLLGFIGTVFAQSDTNMPSVANTADRTFMKQAATDGMAEVQMGQLAMNAAVNQHCAHPACNCNVRADAAYCSN